VTEILRWTMILAPFGFIIAAVLLAASEIRNEREGRKNR